MASVRKLGARWARHLLRVEKTRGAQESDDAYLERVLSGKRARAVREVLRLRERRKARRLVRKRLPELAARDVRLLDTEQVVAQLLARAPALSERLALLHDVLVAGGYESAELMAAQLEPALRKAAPQLRMRAAPILARVFMATGAPARALALFRELAGGQALDHPLRQALELELGERAQPRFKADGALSSFLADAALRRGSSAEVLASVIGSPWSVLLNPELELVLHNAARMARSDSVLALNRFLARYRLGRLTLAIARDANWLSRVRFAESAPARGTERVSVIMSAHNARATIGYAIDSIMAQSYSALELLVADDASTDGTYAFVAERYAREPRVRLFRARENQGTYNTRNQLMAESRGDLITFQDADDFALPTRIASQVRALGKEGRVAAISEWLRVREDGEVAFFPNGRAARLSIVSLMATRAAFAAVGPYPSAKVGADLDIYRRIVRKFGGARVARSTAPLLFGLWSAQSLTRALPSLESGYRAPARRRYSELVFRQDLFAGAPLSDAALREELIQTGNYVTASELSAHVAAPGV